MSEIIAFISAYLGSVVLVSIAVILAKWLFIRSAVKSGVEAALEDVLSRMEIIDTDSVKDTINNF